MSINSLNLQGNRSQPRCKKRENFSPPAAFPFSAIFSSFDFYKEKIPDRMAEDIFFN